jgi:hypothetical protein
MLSLSSVEELQWEILDLIDSSLALGAFRLSTCHDVLRALMSQSDEEIAVTGTSEKTN